jgi:hypothetical protein
LLTLLLVNTNRYTWAGVFAPCGFAGRQWSQWVTPVLRSGTNYSVLQPRRNAPVRGRTELEYLQLLFPCWFYLLCLVLLLVWWQKGVAFFALCWGGHSMYSLGEMTCQKKMHYVSKDVMLLYWERKWEKSRAF